MRAFWPDQLSHYTDRQLLGAGQFGLVYQVQNPILKQKTVIKLIEAIKDIDPVVIKRFRREIKSLQKLNSPHIVKLLNYWIDESFLAFETEYIPGISFENLLSLMKDISYQEKKITIINIISQICQGLEYLHHHHLVHRDIKPSNIFLVLKTLKEKYSINQILRYTEKERFTCKITDLGIVKEMGASVSITRTSDFIGTAAYISPEQAIGKKVNTTSDMYSLGVLWYQLVAGFNPFYRKNVYHTINAHIHEAAKDILNVIPDIEPNLASIIMQLLSKEPNQRGYGANRLRQFLFEIKTIEPVRKTRHQINGIEEKTQKHKCPDFVKFIEQLADDSTTNKLKFVIFKQKSTIQKFFYHLDNLEKLDSIQIFYYLPQDQYDFNYSFTREIIRQADQSEIQEFRKQLAGDSLFTEFLNLYSLDKYTELDKFDRNKIGRIPLPLKIYNWIEFISQLLTFLSLKRKIIIFINPLDQLQECGGTISLLRERLIKEKVFWLCPFSEQNNSLENKKSPGFEQPDTLDLDLLFKEQIKCVIPSHELEKYNFLLGYKISFTKENNPAPLLYKEIRKRYLQYLEPMALSGFLHPVKFVSWLLNKISNNPNKALNFFQQKKLLYFHSNLGMEGMFSFASPELHQEILSAITPAKKKEYLNTILEYWESSDEISAKFLLLKIYEELEEYAKLSSLILNLINLGLLFGDQNRNRKLLKYLLKIENRHNIHITRQLNFHRIYLLIAQKPDPRFHRIGKNFLIQLSDKYKDEKGYLIQYLVLNAFILRDKEIINDILSDPIFRKPINMDINSYLYFLDAFSLYLEENFPQAIKQLSESLMFYYKNELYWNIPLCTYALSRFYADAGDWENAYKYAAMGYHAARAINDYWIIKKCVQHISQNEYYLKNRQNLVDWKRMTRNDFNFSLEMMERIDFRTQIFETTH
jgi:serine/threonine protein kinase